MNGPIAQLVALALHGNAYLADVPATEFLAHNSTAQFCESVRFLRLEKSWFGLGRPSEIPVAESPDLWFAWLKKQDARQLAVRWQPGNDAKFADRMLAGFVGGGGSWVLVIRFGDGRHERWVARWDVGDRERKDRRIWRVTYRCLSSGPESAPPGVSAAAAAANLNVALTEIRAFSAKHKCDGFTQSFDCGLNALGGKGDAKAYHRDLFRGDAPAESADLLEACQHAWVFGGMGSWNDLGFAGADGKEYERVSEQLYRAIVAAIPAAVDAHAATLRR